MKGEIKQTIEVIASHPKTSAAIAASPVYAWINSLNPVLDFIATIAGICLVVVLIAYHWENRKKLKRENDKEV